MLPKNSRFIESIRQKISQASRNKPLRFFFLIFFIITIFYFGFISAPFSFPTGLLVSIEEGKTLSEASNILEEKGIIKSSVFFDSIVRMFFGDDRVISGNYFFKEKKTVFGIISSITSGQYGLTPTKITIPEGSSVAEIAVLFEEKFPDFNEDDFIKIASGDEGYLFPDTYLFLPNVKIWQVYREMRSNFDAKIAEINDEFRKTDKGLHDIVTMASLLEEEARTTQTRKTIAGILWKRIKIGMPLQVDATFLYINGKNTFELTLEDLRDNDSLYNTYKFSGLPPGPITNPGMDSILAALNPIESDYLYYLSDLDGNTHYSVTFEEHKRKKQLYLR